MADLTHVRILEVVWDPISRRLWANTENGCVFRAYNVEKFHFRQAPKMESDHEEGDNA
jgi:hypothetical protein